ncbi:MAG TPA: tryptophanase [Phycisphaerae bacterium]|jgi:tyrosine phenol-lyase|nr:tryptophanase [Phycisphaerae bacterium]HOB73091.1 tryptophanase [Phycisphaerae bacterium]HOJ54028.1 tryptophanase [Phycisphaerae bacterium]HOL26439.1 tryptophanase [Phycisphaerae bacterium]HPP20418.1 tryptophanase [Phycisphaerae bacterium]
MNIKLSNGKVIPIEMHKVRVIQKTTLPPAEQRLKAITEAGYNTFLLRSRDLFLDMLTDSGTNAMSDNQLAAMMVADDAYAGSESFFRLQEAVQDVLGLKYCLPVHQGRAAENLLAKVYVKPGTVIPMNYHFTTTRTHFELAGGKVLEIFGKEALNTSSTDPFKGNIDLDKLHSVIKEYGPEKVAFVRMEATTNLIGGQPFSMENLKAVSKIARENGIPMIVDASLISENAYFIKVREKAYADWTIEAIVKEIMKQADIMYMSGRKSTCVRGGMICTNSKEHYDKMAPWLPVYEGFLTYGGMSSKEVEAMAVGVREMVEIEAASASADMIQYFVELLCEKNIPAVTPPGGLACHVDARKFLPHVDSLQYTAGAFVAALYLVSGVRAMERGTLSNDRDIHTHEEIPADLELGRLAVPRRVHTMSHCMYIADRLEWLMKHRDLVGGLKFCEEPPVLRFFIGKLAPINDWGRKLVDAFKKDFGDNC